MTNNTAIYDSVLAGIAASNGAWLNDPNPNNFISERNAAMVIAATIDSVIPTIQSGVSVSQRQLIESITKGIMIGRSVRSLLPNDYVKLANSIASVFIEYNNILSNTSGIQDIDSGNKFHPITNNKYNLIAWYHPDDITIGPMLSWPDYRGNRTNNPSDYQPAVPGNAVAPIGAMIGGQKYCQMHSVNPNHVGLKLPNAVNIALAGSVTGWGKTIIMARYRNRSSNPGEFGPIMSFSEGGQPEIFFGRKPAAPFSLAFSSNDATRYLLRPATAYDLWTNTKNYRGDSCWGVAGAVTGPTQNNIYWEGMYSQYTPYRVYAGSNIYLGQLWYLAYFPTIDIQEVLILSWNNTSEPTIDDLNDIRDYLNRNVIRRIIWDMDNWGDQLGSPPLPALVEDLMDDCRYQHIMLCEAGRGLRLANALWDMEVGPRLRPGDIYIQAQHAMTTVDSATLYTLFGGVPPNAPYYDGNGCTVNNMLAYTANNAAKTKKLGAIPISARAVGWPDYCKAQNTQETVIGRPLWQGYNAGLSANPTLYSISSVGIPAPDLDPKLIPENGLYLGNETPTQLGLETMAPYFMSAIHTLAPLV